MSEKAFYISELLQKKLKGNLATEEELALNEWMAGHEDNKNLMEQLNDENWVKAELEKFKQCDEVLIKEKIERSLNKGKIIGMRTWKWVAAASIIIGLLVTLRLSKGHQDNEPPLATHDVSAPTETRAVITLADGRKIYLDSADNGTLALEGQTNVIKTADGKIVYDGVESTLREPQGDKPVYNTLTNPRGSKVIDMTLSDGSHVWLNAGSSVKYPVAFIGKERIVEMTGEAYFEVKHNAQQPFKVHLPNGSVVEDIGTSFNINSYSDEADIKTTLIEGSVKVESPALTGTPFSKGGKPTHSVVLSPGQQAILRQAQDDIKLAKDVDLDEVLAWKNGKFYFHSADLPYILRQAQRWYDVDVVYEIKIEKRFNGEIDHNTNLSNLLKALELSGDVKFRIEGKKIIVTR